ncbi:sigma-54 dependent transcriptional regulator [Oscillochloris sp. ZM17-4]|uniref:sigma-54-dependent transcriptional regulator n=1 Tax=Oscillochloris sp. ZM17-4 TaxID=2866714 RepID=UPI001C73076D|nr:sigma-54 dependent transcriptional regulator [Oscillochloris sp. ZM17-4]MBX0330139.1 sigma-54 dependent transcriptional regulator [Oscillochloris sp. ZM17-4]
MALELEGSTILIADDEAPIREMLQDILEQEGARTILAGTGSEALAALSAEIQPDVAILDVRMPPPDGLAVLQQIRSKGIDLPVLIITAQDSSTMTIEAMQRGAYDYLAKPFDTDEILHTVQRALEHRRLTRRLIALEKRIPADPRDILIGHSAPMQQVYKLIGRVAASEATVLITGESGTGKELVAQVLHRSSMRHEGPFVVVNCAALPETLLESELFGHEKGAFTGAMAQRKGRFEQANKGTIFLDEIGEMSPNTQKKLLRVLQERTFERVGGNIAVRVDIRVIAATNRDLHQDVGAGGFREDLYYRLNVVNIHVPPLRDRSDDLPLLIDHFLRKHRVGGRNARLSEAAMAQIASYDWPGNVRQLENAIERAVILAQGSLIGPEHMLIAEGGSAHDRSLADALGRLLDMGGGLDAALQAARQRLIDLAIERSGGDRAAAAQLLGVPEDELSSA